MNPYERFNGKLVRVTFNEGVQEGILRTDGMRNMVYIEPWTIGVANVHQIEEIEERSKYRYKVTFKVNGQIGLQGPYKEHIYSPIKLDLAEAYSTASQIVATSLAWHPAMFNQCVGFELLSIAEDA